MASSSSSSLSGPKRPVPSIASSSYDSPSNFIAPLQERMIEYDNKRPMRLQADIPGHYRLQKWCGALCDCCCMITVPDYHHAIVKEFGRFSRVIEPGTYVVNTCTEVTKMAKDSVIPDFHQGVLLRDNRLVGVHPPGIYFVNAELGETMRVCKDVVVPQFHFGVRTRSKVFVEILEPGRYFALEEELEEHIKVVKETVVAEKHRGVRTVNNVFQKPVLGPGLYRANPVLGEAINVYPEVIVPEGHRGVITRDGMFVGTEDVCMPGPLFVNAVLKEAIQIVPEVQIDEGFIGLKFVDGQLQHDPLQPGRHFANPVIKESISLVNMRVLTKELVPLEIVTKDTTTFTIKSILVYQIVDARRAVCMVENIDLAIREQIKSICHQVLSEHDLDTIMVKKLELSGEIRERVSKNCKEWGVLVHGIDIKELILPEELKREMTSSARAKRAAESMIIKAQAEVKNAESMKQVADMLDSRASTHIREIDALKEICKNPNVKILFVAPGLHGLMDERSLGRVIGQEFSAEQSVPLCTRAP